MNKKLKSRENNAKKEDFEDCLDKWEESRDKEEKLITPVSVPTCEKNYTIEERKIVLKKQNKKKDNSRLLYDGLRMQRR